MFGGWSDEQLLKRIGALYSTAFVAMVAKELADARQVAGAAELLWSARDLRMGIG